ncbi:MAG: hypothetical protein ACHQCH_00600 [Solirubrobacterales bacterium]
MKASKTQRHREAKRNKKRNKPSAPDSAKSLVSADRTSVRDIVPGLGTGARSGLEQGRFYPELTLGPGALSSDRHSQLQRFLVAVVHQRGHPLHLANLWNALYFNYDLGHWGFHLDQIQPQRMPTRSARARDVSLPVGGFLRVHTEAACADLVAEVIYKEGAHVDVDEGWIPPGLSGAPATVAEQADGQRTATVRERFVLDLDAFGPDGNNITETQYKRLCERARWVDEHGHLVMEATYTPESAGLDDLDYYAEYLLAEHRDGLLAFCFSEELNDDELREALLRSLDAVRELASSTRELCSWRGRYFFLSSAHAERLAYDGPLGEADMRDLFRGVSRVPGGESRCYSAIGPRILELLERDGLVASEKALLQGGSYAASVCYANTYIADALVREQPDGLLDGGVHVRLDDDWQAGGIWRAERVCDPQHYSLKTLSPLLPLHLGYAETDDEATVRESAANDEQPLGSSQTGFKVPLTQRDRALGRLRLSTAAAQALAPGPVDVAIRHREDRSRTAVERDGTSLYGIEYPWDFSPGIVLHCNVEAHGSVVRIRTVPVAPPIVASDGTSFDSDTNLTVYEREMGMKELSAKDKRGAPTLTELINRAFRLRGRTRDHGVHLLTLCELAAVILGPGWRAVDTRPIVEALATMDLERIGAEYAWRPRVTRRTRSSDRSMLAAYGEAKARGRLARVVRHHLVPMHLRRFTEGSGRAPGQDKRRGYAHARQQYGMYGVLPEQLPPNCTWVVPHDRGGSDNVSADHLEQSEQEVAGTAP